MEEIKDNVQEIKDDVQGIEIIQHSDELQDIIGNSSRWLSVLSFVYSLLVVAGLFAAAFLIEYKGQRLLEILLAPAMKYFKIL